MLVGQLEDELLADKARGLEEALVFLGLQLLLGLVRIGFLVEVEVVAVDDARDAEATVLEALLVASLLEGGVVVGRDAVVVGVKGLDYVVVQLLVENLGILAVEGEASLLRDDLLAKVLVDQAGGRELGRAAAGEELVELALVVVVAVLGVVVNAADVDDGVAGLEEGGVAGADQRAGGIAGEGAEQVDGKGLVGVEVAAEEAVSNYAGLNCRTGTDLWVPMAGPDILRRFAWGS